MSGLSCSAWASLWLWGVCSRARPDLCSWGMWDLSSLTRDWTHIPYVGRWILNHWIAMEDPEIYFLNFHLRLLLGRKVMFNLDSIFKSTDITLPTKVRLVKAMVFPVVMYGCESWTWRKLSGEELMLLNCGVEDSCESLGLQGDPTSSS